jgi:hypothetical protein
VASPLGRSSFCLDCEWLHHFVATQTKASAPLNLVLCASTNRKLLLKLDFAKRKNFYSFVIVVGCVLIVGPELGLGLELLATVELLGLEMFVFCFIAPFWHYMYRLESWLQKIDPYLFVPSKQQVLTVPGILAHAIPGYMVLLLWCASIFVFSS